MGAEGFYSIGARGITLRVRARPGAHRDAIAGVREGELLVEVKARAEKGKANEELVRVLARELGVPRGSIVLKRGGSSRRKVLELPPGCAAALERLSAALGPNNECGPAGEQDEGETR